MKPKQWKPKYRRLFLLAASLVLLSSAVGLMLLAFRDGLVFFYTPTELHLPQNQAKITPHRVVRIGGMVAEKSLQRSENGITYRFIITDMEKDIAVVYSGVLPDLFREGQGVVAEGQIRADNVLVATSVLAKHDENYMPKNMVDQLKENGQWQNPNQKNGNYGAESSSK